MNKYFTSSLILDNHPLLIQEKNIRRLYYSVLEKFVTEQNDSDYIKIRLEQLKSKLSDDSECSKDNVLFVPSKKNLILCLICDTALILLDDKILKKAVGAIKNYAGSNKYPEISLLFSVLMSDKVIPSAFSFLESLINQYRINRKFSVQKTEKYIFTANISSGKSTLINAVAGRKITATAQETCTGNLSYLYNKPYDDGKIHIYKDSLNFNASPETLKNTDRNKVSHTAAYFNIPDVLCRKICLTDTPGVNSVVSEQHGKITKNILKSDDYSKIIYVMNAEKLCTEDEYRYLKWIAKNIPVSKIIFVINKLDNFNDEDNIDKSVADVKKWLSELGFKKPVVCPVSARFALLTKLKIYNNAEMTAFEKRLLGNYIDKFRFPMYDLSRFYNMNQNAYDNSDLMKSGICGLENILFGGNK